MSNRDLGLLTLIALVLMPSLLLTAALAFAPMAREPETLTASRCANLDVADNKWHQAMFVLDRDTASIYCDGVRLAAKSGISAHANTPTELLIGADFNQWRDGVWGRFVGIIDEIRISNVLRPPSKGPLEVDKHTIAIWHFDEAGGDTIYDSSPNSLNGHVYRCKRTADGFRGGAMEFMGKGYIVVPDSDLLTQSTLCIEISFKTGNGQEKGYAAPVLISKYVNNFPAMSEYCAQIGGKGGRGLTWTSYGGKNCSCPPHR